MIDFLGDADPWTAASSGERLLFLLLRHHIEWRVLVETLRETKLRLGRRYDNLTNFFIGSSVLHLQQRLLRLAQDVRDREPDRWEQAKRIRQLSCDIIQLYPIDYTGDFGELVEEILLSAEQMAREPGPALKRAVLHSAPPSCYSCGRLFGGIYPDALDGLRGTADHIWPRALGGDSIAANLLPACPACNGAKGHIASWQMAWIQPVVFADVDEANGLKSVRKEVRIALHMRAAMDYAHDNGSTLRDALIAIGPREPPTRVDADQGYDFFNLRVHDPARTNVNWVPN